MRHTIEERDARRLLGGGPVALLTTAWHGNWNVMPAAFVTPVSIDPPFIGVAVHPARHTHDMIKFSEEFALNIPTQELLHHCQYLGSVSGTELNKLELTRLPTFAARKVQAPLLEGCVGWIECGVEDAYRIGDHTSSSERWRLRPLSRTRSRTPGCSPIPRSGRCTTSA